MDEETIEVVSPLAGTVVALPVAAGADVVAGTTLVVVELMKMQHPVTAPEAGTVERLTVAIGDDLTEGQPVAVLSPSTDGAAVAATDEDERDLDAIRDDLAEVLERHRRTRDEARPEAVAKRHDRGQRTARENVDDLVDAGSFVEYAPLVVAAQRNRRELDELIERTPADGLVTGIGTVNADRFGDAAARTAVLAYDYTVLAGTQGYWNHRKKDRLFEIAAAERLPVVLYAEGGGGRPGDTDIPVVGGLDVMAFALFAGLSGRVPLVGIVSGRCFAGNAALLGCCDVIIATEGTNIGMGGPAMIAGGGLGEVEPEDIGPLDAQVAGGVVDIAVADEAEATAVAKRYLGYLQGALEPGDHVDQRELRWLVPEDRQRVYDIRAVIRSLCDTDSVLELRAGFAPGMVTALARIAGRPLGVIANDTTSLAGAITPDGADKAARFLQLCDAFGLPVLSLCDTPGMMVGPEVEARAQVRHVSRMFVTARSLSVPFATIVLRKGYGLGAQAMAGGSFHANRFTVSWPTGEFGAMGLEGAVQLGFRRELDAIDDPAQRHQRVEEMVALLREHGKAINAAMHHELDDVIDPADSRAWIQRLLLSDGWRSWRDGPGRPCIDTW